MWQRLVGCAPPIIAGVVTAAVIVVRARPGSPRTGCRRSSHQGRFQMFLSELFQRLKLFLMSIGVIPMEY